MLAKKFVPLFLLGCSVLMAEPVRTERAQEPDLTIPTYSTETGEITRVNEEGGDVFTSSSFSEGDGFYADGPTPEQSGRERNCPATVRDCYYWGRYKTNDLWGNKGADYPACNTVQETMNSQCQAKCRNTGDESARCILECRLGTVDWLRSVGQKTCAATLVTNWGLPIK